MRNTSFDGLLTSLADLIADAVTERLADRVSQPPQNEQLVDEPEMARRLNVSQPTLQRMRVAGDVPFIQLGRRIAYHPPTVLAALCQKNEEGGAL